MHFLLWETLSFNLIYVAACYLVGTGMCHNMVGLLQHYVVNTINDFFSITIVGGHSFLCCGTPILNCILCIQSNSEIKF